MRAAVCRLYYAFCKRYGPGKLTISAWAHKRAVQGRGHHLRDFIDDHFLVWRGEFDHCARQYERETRVTQRTGS